MTPTPRRGPRPIEVPPRLDRAAAISWRLIVVAAAFTLVGFVFVELRVVVVPLVLATFIAAVLAPPAAWLGDRGWRPLAATWVVILLAGTVIVGIGFLIIPRLVSDLGGIGTALAEAYEDIKDWLVDGPVGLSAQTVESLEQQVVANLQGGGATGLFDRAASAIEIVTGLILTLVVAFFYIKDGRRFTEAAVGMLAQDRRERARLGLTTAWEVLRRYLVGVVIVGAVDATVIGIGLAIIGVPLILPLMLITFLAAFFPIVGAIIAGLVATLIALASGGVTDALLVLGLTTLVQQLDGDVVAPIVYSRAVQLHPLAVLLALTAGAVLAGIIGALLAVPVLAVTLAVRRVWAEMDMGEPQANGAPTAV